MCVLAFHDLLSRRSKRGGGGGGTKPHQTSLLPFLAPSSTSLFCITVFFLSSFRNGIFISRPAEMPIGCEERGREGGQERTKHKQKEEEYENSTDIARIQIPVKRKEKPGRNSLLAQLRKKAVLCTSPLYSGLRIYRYVHSTSYPIRYVYIYIYSRVASVCRLYNRMYSLYIYIRIPDNV